MPSNVEKKMFCPVCGQPRTWQERRINGYSGCDNDHKFKSSDAVARPGLSHQDGPLSLEKADWIAQQCVDLYHDQPRKVINGMAQFCINIGLGLKDAALVIQLAKHKVMEELNCRVSKDVVLEGMKLRKYFKDKDA